MAAMRKAWEAGFTAGFTGDFGEDVELSAALDEKVSDVDFWVYDARKDASSEKKGKRAPKTPSPKKPTGDPEDLARAPFDSSKCRARKFNKGYPLQCWKIPTDGEDVCHLCMARRDDDSQDFWGYFDEPLEDCCLNKDGKPHAWKALASARSEKKESDKKEKKLAKEKAKAEKEAAKAKKKTEQEKKKRLKGLKKKAKSEEKAAEKKPEAEIEDPIEEDPPVEDNKAKPEEKPVEKKPAAENETGGAENSEEEPDLDEDTQSIGDPEPEVVFEEYVHDGYTMKWNKVTNDLLDPDDDELLGKMVFDDDGNPKAEINVDESDDSDEDE